MSNKYLEKIAGFTGQSLKHLSERRSVLRKAIDNHYQSAQGSLDPYRIARKVRNAVVGSIKGKKSAVDTFTKADKAQKRLNRIDTEIKDRKHSAFKADTGSTITETLGKIPKILGDK